MKKQRMTQKRFVHEFYRYLEARGIVHSYQPAADGYLKWVRLMKDLRDRGFTYQQIFTVAAMMLEGPFSEDWSVPSRLDRAEAAQ